MLDWTLLSKEVPVHMLDVVTISSDGLVTQKDTFLDVAQANELAAMLEVEIGPAAA